MNNIIKGSVADIARQNNQSIATTFLSVDCIVLVDTSGSMGARDSSNNNSRYEQACIELESLQANLPGKIGVISFSDRVMFCPDGRPINFGMSTDLAAALKFAKVADGDGMRFIVISDGSPNDPNAALKEAHTYTCRIDTIYVGPEGGYGMDFLQRLAAASGGSHIQANQVKELAASVQRLLAV